MLCKYVCLELAHHYQFRYLIIITSKLELVQYLGQTSYAQDSFIT